jgi:hypothetical protein
VKRSLCLLALLAGCAHQPVREVAVATPVTCVDRNQIPAEPPRIAQRLTGNAKRDIEIVAENARDLRTWGHEMRALLERCVGRAPQR